MSRALPLLAALLAVVASAAEPPVTGTATTPAVSAPTADPPPINRSGAAKKALKALKGQHETNPPAARPVAKPAPAAGQEAGK
ncbi:MAG TPA: hypothetical protein VFF82_13590 [Rhodocyclaceae bacterium]|nr:hypothetical protein [Rhodocyclaceae bacterium]